MLVQVEETRSGQDEAAVHPGNTVPVPSLKFMMSNDTSQGRYNRKNMCQRELAAHVATLGLPNIIFCVF